MKVRHKCNIIRSANGVNQSQHTGNNVHMNNQAQGKKETCNKTANKTHESTTTISDKTVATSSKQNSMHHRLKNK